MTRNRFAKILTAAMMIISVTASSVVGGTANGDIIFSDEYDARTQSASKAIKSDNVYEVTSATAQLGDESRLTRKAAGKEGWAIYELPANATYITFRAVNGAGDTLVPELHVSSDMTLWTNLPAAVIEEISGFSGYPGCEYTYVNFPKDAKYVKLVIPNAAGDFEFLRQITGFKIFSGEIPDYVPMDAFYEKNHIFDSDEYSEAVKFMYGIGALKSEMINSGILKKQMKRGEFADLVTKIMLGNSEIVSSYIQAGRYRDVDARTPYAGSISFVTDNDIMREVSEMKFMPESMVTKEQLAFSLVHFLGYQYFVEELGEDPIQIAIKEKLFSTALKDRDITGEVIIEALYNAINSTYMNENGDKITKSENDYLTNILDIEKSEGQITQTVLGALMGDADIKVGKVGIDGVVYNINDIYINNYLGHNITFWYKIGENEERHIISYKINKNDKETLKISAEDLNFNSGDFSLNRLVYENDKNKTKYVKMNIEYLVYNGERVYEIKKEDFNIKDGSITLIDTGSKDGYETVLIEEYKDYFIDSVNKTNYKITGKYGFELFEFDSEIYKNINILKSNGDFANMSAIQKGNVVSVAAGRNKQYVKLVISDKTVTGTVSSINEEGKLMIEKEIYKLSETYKNHLKNNSSEIVEITAGTDGVFYLNFEGKISGIDKFLTVRKYGYLLNARLKSSLETGIEFKISTEEGTLAVFEGRSDNIMVENQSDVLKYDTGSLYRYLLSRNTDPDKTIKEELVKYELDREGKIRYLGFSDTRGEFTMDFEGRAYFTGGGMIVNERYGIKGAKMFIIPEDRDRKDLYTNNIKLRSGREGSADMNKYKIKLYDVNSMNVASAIVVEVPELDGLNDGSTLWYNSLSIVVSTGIELKKETLEEVVVIKVMTGGVLKEYTIDNSAIIDFAPAGVLNGNDLKKGDIIQLGFAVNGQVARVNFWHRVGLDNFIKGEYSKTMSTGYGTNLDEARRGIYGVVERTSPPYTVVNDGSENWFADISSSSVIVYEKNNGRIYTAGASELTAEDVVIMRTNGGIASEIIIIR